MVTSLYRNSSETVYADFDSEFYHYLNCTFDNSTNATTDTEADEIQICSGTSFDYVKWFFGGLYGQESPTVSILVLGLFLFLARFGTWVALRYIRHA